MPRFRGWGDRDDRSSGAERGMVGTTRAEASLLAEVQWEIKDPLGLAGETDNKTTTLAVFRKADRPRSVLAATVDV